MLTEKTTKPTRIVIMSKSIGPKYEHKFFHDVQDAILQGYRIADTGLRADASMRNFKGRIGRVVLILESARLEMEEAAEADKLAKAEADEAAAKLITDQEAAEIEAEALALEELEKTLSDADKELSSGVVENSETEIAIKAEAEADKSELDKAEVEIAKADAEKETSTGVSTGDIDKEAADKLVAEQEAADKKEAMIAKGKATKAANKAKKDAEKTK